MSQTQQILEQVLPDTTQNDGVTEAEATTPLAQSDEISEIKVPVKFNKETREIPLSEAAILAQKGMKYDTLSEDIKRLRNLAASNGQNISDFISTIENNTNTAHKMKLLESCGGNNEIVEHILSLEKKEKGDGLIGLGELLRECPEIKSEKDIPEAVLNAATERGGNVFDEYLRYTHSQNREAQNALLRQAKAESSSLGSQSKYAGGVSPVNAEFIRGLWK